MRPDSMLSVSRTSRVIACSRRALVTARRTVLQPVGVAERVPVVDRGLQEAEHAGDRRAQFVRHDRDELRLRSGQLAQPALLLARLAQPPDQDDDEQ